MSVGAGRRFAVTAFVHGTATGPARCVQLTYFDPPRSAAWEAAFTRATRERIWPAPRTVEGVVASAVGQADDRAAIVGLLAETVDALDTALVRVMETELLPGEDPALLTGRDRVDVQRLLHVVLPAGEIGVSGPGVASPV